ncbi:MAG: serine hydrolase [Melioribacteraceae bacterium]|nr:serine hydrolase [Melioribacteraceae bacterium]
MNKFIHKICVSILAVLIITASVPAQNIDNSLSAELQKQLDQFRSQYQFKGMSASIVSNEYGKWNGASGVSQESGNNLITSDMIFGIGSVTKTYIATLIMQLEDEGILSINDSLTNWLPSYPNIESTITLKQLLKHKSGISDLIQNPLFFEVLNKNHLHVWSDEEIILKLVDKPLFQPGTSYSYSNTNYILLGMILKKATGKSISVLLRERILVPLNLNHTFLAIEDSLKGNIAHGWLDVDGDSNLDDFTDFWQPNAFYSALWTAGAMYSTAEEAAVFMNALFKGELVCPNSLDKMMEINSQSHNGLGLFGFTTPNNTFMIGHDGFTLEYSSFVYHDVASKSTFSVLVNQRDLDQHSMMLIMGFIKTLKDYMPTSTGSKATKSDSFQLNQNWPNPFNPSTNISFTLEKADVIQLNIYSILGEIVKTLVDGELSAGKHSYLWDGKNDSGMAVTSGTYIYHLIAGQVSGSKQMLLIR